MPDLILIVDTSYSIQNYIHDYLKMVNKIIELHYSYFPQNTSTLYTFNDNNEQIYLNRHFSTLRPITKSDIPIKGTTSLYDNLGVIITKMMMFRGKTNQEPPIVVILTDGEDNSSRKLNINDVSGQIQISRCGDWKYIFLGMSEDAIKKGKFMGVNSSILYNDNPNSFNTVCEVIKTIFSKNAFDIDADVRFLEESMEKMSI